LPSSAQCGVGGNGSTRFSGARECQSVRCGECFAFGVGYVDQPDDATGIGIPRLNACTAERGDFAFETGALGMRFNQAGKTGFDILGGKQDRSAPCGERLGLAASCCVDFGIDAPEIEQLPAQAGACRRLDRAAAPMS
jgi:hypothetical protein